MNNPFLKYLDDELDWIEIVIQADINAWKNGGEVQLPQYTLEDCYEQLAMVQAEIARRKEAKNLS